MVKKMRILIGKMKKTLMKINHLFSVKLECICFKTLVKCMAFLRAFVQCRDELHVRLAGINQFGLLLLSLLLRRCSIG